MQVNICHRLIKNMTENGYVFFDNCRINRYINLSDIPKGLYATKDFNTGEIITKLKGELNLIPTRESIHIGNGLHVIDSYGRFINHSFEPNTRIEFNNVVAIKDIKKYDEITFNYNETEINMAQPFEVDGIKVCGNTI
jgi:hypothetical protein